MAIVAILVILISKNATAQDRNPKAENLFREALAARKNRDFDGAIAKATEALATNPKYVDAYQLRADAWTQKKRFDQVVADCNAALAINPSKVRILLMRAAALTETGKAEEALRDYDALVGNESASPLHPRFYRALAYIKLGRRKEAIPDLEAEIDTHRTRLPLLGDLFREDEQFTKAVRCYTLAIGDILNEIAPREGETPLEKWARPEEEPIPYGPQGVEPKWEGPQAFFEQQREAAVAAEQYEASLEEEFKRPPSETEALSMLAPRIDEVKDRKILATLYANRATALLAVGNVLEASCDFNDALLFTEEPGTLRKTVINGLRSRSSAIESAKLTEGSVSRLIDALDAEIPQEADPTELLRLKAMLGVASGDDAKALEGFSALLAKQQTDVTVLQMAAECALRLNDFRKAGFAANCLVKLSAADHRTYEIRAIAYQAVGQRDRAIADLIECIRLITVDYQFIAQLHVAREAEDTARKVIEQTTAEIESEPQRGSANYSRRAEAYMVLGDYKSALADYNRADKLSSPGYYNCQIGNCLLALNEVRRALVAFNEDAKESDSDGLLGRAQSLAALGRCDEAIPDFEAAMKSEPKKGVIYSGLAEAFLKNNDLKSALQVAEAGRELNDWDGMNVATLAAVYAADKDYKEAAHLQRKALERARSAEQAKEEAGRFCEYLLDAADTEFLTNLLDVIKKEAAHRKEVSDHYQRAEQDRQRAKEEADKNRNPYKELTR